MDNGGHHGGCDHRTLETTDANISPALPVKTKGILHGDPSETHLWMNLHLGTSMPSSSGKGSWLLERPPQSNVEASTVFSSYLQI